MPEAFAVLAVFFVSGLIYVIAKVQARKPEFHQPAVVMTQLRQQQDWLQQRLGQADREKWSPEMRRPIAEELETIQRKLAALGARAEVSG